VDPAASVPKARVLRDAQRVAVLSKTSTAGELLSDTRLIVYKTN